MANLGKMSLGLAAFAGGGVAALLAGRLLPPVLAQAYGTARGRDPFQALADDHRKVLAALASLERTPNDAVARRTALLLKVKRSLTAHALAEEDVIYPLLNDQAQASDDVKRLYGDHAAIKIHLRELEQIPKGDPSWLDTVRALRHLIEDHARQEEDVEFPRLRAMLDNRSIAKLSGDVQREKALLL